MLGGWLDGDGSDYSCDLVSGLCVWQVSNNIVIVYHYIITVKTVILIIWSFINCLTYRWSIEEFLHRSMDQKLKENTKCYLTDHILKEKIPHNFYRSF